MTTRNNMKVLLAFPTQTPEGNKRESRLSEHCCVSWELSSFPSYAEFKALGYNRTVSVWVKIRRSGLKNHPSLFQVYIESGKETPPASVSSSVNEVSNSNSPFARTQCYTVHESALWPAKCCRNMSSWYPLLCASLWVSLSECEYLQGCACCPACCLALSAVLPWPLVLAWPLALQTPSHCCIWLLCAPWLPTTLLSSVFLTSVLCSFLMVHHPISPFSQVSIVLLDKMF